MKLSTGFSQKLSSNILSLNWIFIVATILLICCSCINSKPTDSDQLNEHQIDSVYPAFLITDDLVERAAPRLGRASPRLGRASPRLGRQAAYILPRLNHAGRYFLTDEEALYDNPEVDFYFDAKRAAPRLGRSA